MANYFGGKYGRLRITGFADTLFKLGNWRYEIDKSLIDITNFRSRESGNPVEQSIGNIFRGTVTAEGTMTDAQAAVISANLLKPAQEVVMDLYFYYGAPSNVGFTGIKAIMDNFEFSVDVRGTGTFTLTAKLNTPRL